MAGRKSFSLHWHMANLAFATLPAAIAWTFLSRVELPQRKEGPTVGGRMGGSSSPSLSSPPAPSSSATSSSSSSSPAAQAKIVDVPAKNDNDGDGKMTANVAAAQGPAATTSVVDDLRLQIARLHASIGQLQERLEQQDGDETDDRIKVSSQKNKTLRRKQTPPSLLPPTSSSHPARPPRLADPCKKKYAATSHASPPPPIMHISKARD